MKNVAEGSQVGKEVSLCKYFFSVSQGAVVPGLFTSAVFELCS